MNMHYVASALEEAEWPRLLDPRGTPLPEIALAGRSNVGKSTLINLLAGRKKMAHVSSMPGKTQRLQFFQAEERLVLVDLPGFGYAKAPPALQQQWSKAIDLYLHTRKSLAALLLLIDMRRGVGEEERELLAWAQLRKIPVLPIFTKTDMLSPAECERTKKEAEPLLVAALDPVCVPISRRILWNALNRLIPA